MPINHETKNCFSSTHVYIYSRIVSIRSRNSEKNIGRISFTALSESMALTKRIVMKLMKVKVNFTL